MVKSSMLSPVKSTDLAVRRLVTVTSLPPYCPLS